MEFSLLHLLNSAKLKEMSWPFKRTAWNIRGNDENREMGENSYTAPHLHRFHGLEWNISCFHQIFWMFSVAFKPIFKCTVTILLLMWAVPFKGDPGWQRPARTSHFSVSKNTVTFFFSLPTAATGCTIAMFYTIISSLLYFICTLFQHNELNMGGHKSSRSA